MIYLGRYLGRYLFSILHVDSLFYHCIHPQPNEYSETSLYKPIKPFKNEAEEAVYQTKKTIREMKTGTDDSAAFFLRLFHSSSPPLSLSLSLSPILSLSLSISIYLSLSISLSLFLSDSLTLFSSLFSIYLSSYYISKYHSHNRTTSKEHDVFLQWRRSSIRSIDQRCTAGTPII